jgi:hypothetical protein
LAEFVQKLIPEIKFVPHVADYEKSPLELSTGTLAMPSSSRYERDAVVPSEPWRKLTSEEVVALTSESPPEHYSAISRVSLPTHLLQPFEPLRLAAADGANGGQLNALLTESAFNMAIHSVMDYVNAQLRPSGGNDPTEELSGGIYVRPPAQCTITTDHNSGKYVGLHVDNWSFYPIEKRAKAPNRITINLGCQDRYFLFINVSVGAMYEKVRALVRGNHHGTAIGRVFMSLFPSYPVVRLRIAPGEGYIAPTENVVHDASTNGMTAWDITLSLRGRIALLPNE